MKRMIENYVNGNLTDARRQAKSYSFLAIRAALVETLGYSENKAGLVAHWLKTGKGWQAACDAN